MASGVVQEFWVQRQAKSCWTKVWSSPDAANAIEYRNWLTSNKPRGGPYRAIKRLTKTEVL